MNYKYKFIDLFAGLGGFRLAFENNDCVCVFSSEIDKQVAETYFMNFNDYPSGDITQIDEDSIPDHDILCAGFPCQAFSVAGLRKGFEDARGTLFFDVARILNKKRPKAFILENVKGITNHDSGKTLAIILKILDALGYEFSYQILNAKDFGVPQHRERWYCVGIRKDLNISINDYKFPVKHKQQIYLDKIINTTNVGKDYNISEICKKHINKFIKLKNINVTDITLAYEIRPSRCQFKTDGISPCLTAKMGTGGNNVPVIVKQMRKLTELECLQIMGYPSTYKIGKGHIAYKQIGNSVVVPIITELAKNLVELLDKSSVNEVGTSENIISLIDYKKYIPETIIKKDFIPVSEQLCIFPLNDLSQL